METKRLFTTTSRICFPTQLRDIDRSFATFSSKSIVNSKRFTIFASGYGFDHCPIDILKAKHRASFSSNGNLRNSLSSKGKNWKRGMLYSCFCATTGADFCHIPFSRFSQDLRCRISARSLRLSVYSNLKT